MSITQLKDISIWIQLTTNTREIIWKKGSGWVEYLGKALCRINKQTNKQKRSRQCHCFSLQAALVQSLALELCCRTKTKHFTYFCPSFPICKVGIIQEVISECCKEYTYRHIYSFLFIFLFKCAFYIWVVLGCYGEFVLCPSLAKLELYFQHSFPLLVSGLGLTIGEFCKDLAIPLFSKGQWGLEAVYHLTQATTNLLAHPAARFSSQAWASQVPTRALSSTSLNPGSGLYAEAPYWRSHDTVGDLLIRVGGNET